MSVIDKYPFINAVLTSLSDEDLASLQECVNGAGGSSVFKSILAGSPHLLKTTDKGVYPIELEVAPSGTAQTVYPGFLIYNDDYCVLISFATERSQILTVLNLTRVNDLWKSEIKPFELSITDLRSELFDVAGGSGGGSGSDSGSGDGADQDIELFDKVVLNIDSNIDTETTQIDNNTRYVYNIKTTNSVDDINNARKLLSNASSILNIVLTDLEGAKQTIGSILKWTNYNDSGYLGVPGGNFYATNIDENSIGAAFADTTNYLEKAWLEFSQSTFYGLRLVMQPYAGKESDFYDFLHAKLSSYTVTLEVVCPKDKITVQGSSQGGGTVEAEPIVSIKMTNLDLGATNETATGEDIRDVQLYCTKETWNNMVAMTKQLDSSLNITYDNFGTIYANLPTQTQGFLIGYLMMDYINGKVLPDAYVEEQLAVQGAKQQTFLKSSMSLQNTLTNNVKVVSSGIFEGNNYFPSVDRTTVVYTTANTVITVEEIAGPAIGASGGSSGGSGTSTTEFHAENGLIQMKGVYTAGGLDYTISSYISGKDLLTFVLAMKQASPLFRDLPVTQDTTTAELVEILQNAMDSVDQNVLAGLGYYFLEAGFGISIDQAGFGVNGEGVSSLYFDDSGTFPNGDAHAYYSYKGGQKQLLFYANDVTNATFELSELTSGEITISGGSSGSGSSASSESSYTFAKGTLTIASESFSDDPYIYLGVSLTSEQTNALVNSKSLKLKLDFDTDSQMFAYRTLIFNVISSIKDADGDYVGQTTVGMTGVEYFAYIRINNNNNSFVLEVHTEKQQVHDQLVQGFNAFLSTLSAVIYYN